MSISSNDEPTQTPLNWHEGSNCSAQQHDGPMVVLIADDDVDSRASLGELLELAGHSIHSCGDGREALRLARELHPDFVFLDIEMPGLNGYDVCRAIRASDDFRDTRIYAVSGLRGADHEHRCRDEGFSGQLTKPLDVTALAGLL